MAATVLPPIPKATLAVCPTCQAEFPEPAALLTHVEEVHGGRTDPRAPNSTEPISEVFTCGLCAAVFATPTQLAAHGSEPHGRAPPTGGPA